MIVVFVVHLKWFIVRYIGSWVGFITHIKVSMRGEREWFSTVTRNIYSGFANIFFKSVGIGKDKSIDSIL